MSDFQKFLIDNGIISNLLTHYRIDIKDKEITAHSYILATGGKSYPRSIIKDFSNANQRGRFHPTQKPVALMEYLIKTYTNESETVLDFTMGSGSTGVACKNLNRKFIGVEMDEGYFNIAKDRITNS